MTPCCMPTLSSPHWSAAVDRPTCETCGSVGYVLRTHIDRPYCWTDRACPDCDDGKVVAELQANRLNQLKKATNDIRG